MGPWPTSLSSFKPGSAEDEAAAREGLKVRAQPAQALGWFDPVRVLAECVAKRKILGNVPLLVTDLAPEVGGTSEYVLMCLASTYADHPDYQEGWIIDGPLPGSVS
jgi:hypothetical protein